MLRYAMSARWVPWHLLCLVAATALFGLGVWQWNVSTSSLTPDGAAEWNLRNLVYALQWWAFGCFGVWFWWRFIRDQRDADLASAAPPPERVRDAAEPEVTDTTISLDGPAADRLRRRSTLPDANSTTER